jgi:hypothetical protein
MEAIFQAPSWLPEAWLGGQVPTWFPAGMCCQRSHIEYLLEMSGIDRHVVAESV